MAKLWNAERKNPAMGGWLAMPIISSSGLNYGLIETSHEYEGDFTEADDMQLSRLAKLTSKPWILLRLFE